MDRLHNIVDALSPEQIRALLTLLDTSQPISDEDFRRRIEAAPGEELDEETTSRILAAEAEDGERISHEALKNQLGL